MQGIDKSQEYCQDNKKTDPDVIKFRPISKTAVYSSFNDAGAPSFKASLNKAFVDVTLEDCQLAKDALGEAFPGYNAYAQKLKIAARKSVQDLPEGRFAQYRTHDGRLFHVQAVVKEGYNGGTYDYIKLGEITSSQLISPEALAMKKAGLEILEFYRSNRHLGVKINTMCHDDISGQDPTDDKVFVKFAYNAIAQQFNAIVPSGGGMPIGDEYALKCLMNNYSEK